MPFLAAASNGPVRLPLTCSIVTPGFSRPVIWMYQFVGSLKRGFGGGAFVGANGFAVVTNRDSIDSGTHTSRGRSARRWMPVNDAGSTPTIVTGTLLRRTLLPTMALSPPNRFCQNG